MKQTAQGDREPATAGPAAPSAAETAPRALRIPGGLTSIELAGALLSAGAVIAALYFGRDILIPLVLAFLLGFVLSPLVQHLKRWGVPRAAAVSIVLTACLATLAVAGLGLTSQVRELSAELPVYRSNLELKIRDLRRRIAAPGMFDGARQAMDTVAREVERDQATGRIRSASRGGVQFVEAPQLSTWQQAREWFAVVGGPLATAGIVFVFLFLVLLDRQDLRDRLLRLLGGNLHRTTDAMNEAGSRITRYLTMQLIVNVSYGIPMAAGLWLIGVPGAIVWGTVAAVLRFMPYVGSMVSAVLPLALAFAVDPGWSMVLYTLALIAVLEVVSNNIVEPWLYGTSTGLSALSLLVSASFWTVLWGPIGLVLATPLMVCLLVIGRHLPQLQFLDVLLGSRPALGLPMRLYQRLLANDAEEAIDLAVDNAQVHGVAGFYNRAGVPALRQASDDHASLSSSEHRLRIVAGMEQVINELEEQFPAPKLNGPVQAVCIGAKWEVDALAARMLSHTLQIENLNVEHRGGALHHADAVAALDLRGARIVCLSLFSAFPQTQARLLCRRLRRRWPDLHIVLAVWNAPIDWLADTVAKDLGADALVTTVEEAVMSIGQQLGAGGTTAYLPAPVPADDAVRVSVLRASGLLAMRGLPQLEAATQRAADIFDVPLAMVSLIDAEHDRLLAASGALASAIREGALVDDDAVSFPRALSVAGHVVAHATTLVIEDVARDPRFAGNPVLIDHGLRFYAGTPLRDPAGVLYGAFALLDTEPRAFTKRDARLLEAMTKDLMSTLLGVAVGNVTLEEASIEDPAPAVEAASSTVGQLVPR